MAKAADQKGSSSPASPQQGRTQVRWDTTNLRSSYANFCNANSTREEVVLNFGVNKTWERGPQDALDIELNHRIVLSPFAAKRLTELLQNLMKEYESRYGALPEK
jgi:Protein of unknown function (DUF3467)